MRTGLYRSHPRHLELSPSTREWTLLYDGDCAFCRRCVALLERWDRRGRVRAVPFQAEDALVGLPSIPRAALHQAMHLVAPDGAVYRVVARNRHRLGCGSATCARGR